MSKVALIVKISTKPGRRDDLVAAFAPMIDAVNEEAGTEIYILHVDDNDENASWVYELYTDSDAFGAHSSSDAMGALFGQLGDLVDGAPDMITTTPVSGKGL